MFTLGEDMSKGLPQTPLATVDVIIELDGGIVLVRRKNPPLGWALPGGFVDRGESAAAAARREAKEETGLDVDLVELLGVYSDPARDPRGFYTISTVFIARAGGTPKGGDDAADARAMPPHALPADIVFDHPTIIADYLRLRAGGGRPPVDR
jgi:8-oxo-dGTP diphosphatase